MKKRVFLLDIVPLAIFLTLAPFFSGGNLSLEVSAQVLPGQPPLVVISQPTEGGTIVAPPCPLANCTAEVPFEVLIETGAPVDRVHVELIRTESNTLFIEFDLCFDDPIEGTGCPELAGFVLPANPVQRFTILGEGDWTIRVTAFDRQPLSTSAEAHVSVTSTPITAAGGPVILHGVDPNPAVAGVEVRDGILNFGDALGGDDLSITGENLDNPFLEVYLSPRGLIVDPKLAPSSALPVSDWCRYRAEVLGQSETSLTVAIPPIGTEIPSLTPTDCGPGGVETRDAFAAPWRVAVRDRWIRPERVHEWVAFPDLYKTPALREPYLTLAEPAYPLIHGFGFENRKPGSVEFSEFLSVFGNNAYYCVGAFGVCLTRLIDPIYAAYFLVYKLSMGEGTCNGMAATSLLMRHRDLQPETFDSTVHYPRGFGETNTSFSAEYIEPDFCTPVCSPPRPENLWAVIRANHGVQLSQEFIDEILDDMGGGLVNLELVEGSPSARLNELSTNPQGQVLCFAPSDLHTGHCVTPYAVEGNSIRVYDNNAPGSTSRQITVDPSTNTYTYTMVGGEIWSGKHIWTIPIDVWRNGRSRPGLDELGEFLFILTFGSADALVTTPQGGSWGWQSDGTFVNALPGAVGIPLFGPAPTPTRNVPLVLPMSVPAPDVQVNARGGDYLFHAAQGGRVLQLEVSDSVTGDTDAVGVGYEGSRLSSFAFTPQRPAGRITPKIGMVTGDRESAFFSWFGLSVPANGRVEFKAMSGQRAAEYFNNSGGNTRHYVTLDAADGPSGTSAKTMFGPFNVPAGAMHRTSVLDWPTSTQVLSETDLDGDGFAEQSEMVPGRTMPPQTEITMLVPFSQDFISPYRPVQDPLLSAIPFEAKPVSVGATATGGNLLSLKVGMPRFEGVVDIYLAFFSSSVDPNNIYLFRPDNTFQTLATGLVPWKAATTGPVNEGIFGDIPVSNLPAGTYHLWLLASAPGSGLDGSYYLWETSFVVP